MKHRLILNDEPHDLWLSRRTGGDVLLLEGRELRLGAADDAVVAVDGDTVYIHLAGRAYAVRYEDALDRLASEGSGNAADVAKAPMPGSVVALGAGPGDSVAAGDTLMVIESMKLETAIKAPRDGVVEAVHFQVGQSFDRDAVLITLVAQEG